MPNLTQRDFDHLLWSCHLNFVRGEDSLVRALWAGQPLVWNIYPQDDNAHHAKLESFLDWLEAPDSLRDFHRIWNGLQPGELPKSGRPILFASDFLDFSVFIDAEELLGIVPADEREPYDAREIIARVVDGSHFLEFKATFDSDTVCGHARIDGHRVGLIANNGPIQPTGSVKAAQFIQLCDQSGTPLVFLEANACGRPVIGGRAGRHERSRHALQRHVPRAGVIGRDAEPLPESAACTRGHGLRL